MIIDFYRLIDKIDKNQFIFIDLSNFFFLSIFIDWLRRASKHHNLLAQILSQLAKHKFTYQIF